MAAPTFGAAGTLLAGGTTSASAIPIPSGVVANSVLLAQLHIESGTQTVTPPAGFTEAPNSPSIVGTGAQLQYMHVYWKRASGAEGPGTYSFTHASGFTSGICVRYEGCITTGNPIDVDNSNHKDTTADGLTPSVTLTTTGSDRKVVWMASNWVGGGGTWTPPSGGFTERVDQNLLTQADVDWPTATSTGSVTGSYSSNSSITAWLGALLPVPSAAHTNDFFVMF